MMTAVQKDVICANASFDPKQFWEDISTQLKEIEGKTQNEFDRIVPMCAKKLKEEILKSIAKGNSGVLFDCRPVYKPIASKWKDLNQAVIKQFSADKPYLNCILSSDRRVSPTVHKIFVLWEKVTEGRSQVSDESNEIYTCPEECDQDFLMKWSKHSKGIKLMKLRKLIN